MPTRQPAGEGDPDGFLIHGDCLHGLRWLRDRTDYRFGVCYADPPYNTGINRFEFVDAMERDGWMAMLRDRLELVAANLAESGWLWLQADFHESHRLHTLIEGLPLHGVANRVAWVYGMSARGAKAVSNRLPRNYDTLLAAAAGATSMLNRITHRTAMTVDEAKAKGYRSDATGWFKTAPRGDYTDASLERLEKEGRIFVTARGTRRVRYDLEFVNDRVIEDRPLGDVWLDIPDMMHAPASERLAFAGQKPIALIRRVLELSASAGDWVLDPFAGTGTTAVAALDLGLRFVVIESGEHFDTLLTPRVLRGLKDRPKTVRVVTFGPLG